MPARKTTKKVAKQAVESAPKASALEFEPGTVAAPPSTRTRTRPASSCGITTLLSAG